MEKKEFIKKINEYFGNMSKFYKYLGYTRSAYQLSYKFIHNKNKTENVDLKLLKVLELYERLLIANFELKILKEGSKSPR